MKRGNYETNDVAVGGDALRPTPTDSAGDEFGGGGGGGSVRKRKKKKLSTISEKKPDLDSKNLFFKKLFLKSPLIINQ